MTTDSDSPGKFDPKSYSVYSLLVAGSRFTDDYDEEAAIEHYLELHPGAIEAEVRAELQREIANEAR